MSNEKSTTNKVTTTSVRETVKDELLHSRPTHTDALIAAGKTAVRLNEAKTKRDAGDVSGGLMGALDSILDGVMGLLPGGNSSAVEKGGKQDIRNSAGALNDRYRNDGIMRKAASVGRLSEPTFTRFQHNI